MSNPPPSPHPDNLYKKTKFVFPSGSVMLKNPCSLLSVPFRVFKSKDSHVDQRFSLIHTYVAKKYSCSGGTAGRIRRISFYVGAVPKILSFRFFKEELLEGKDWGLAVTKDESYTKINVHPLHGIYSFFSFPSFPVVELDAPRDTE